MTSLPGILADIAQVVGEDAAQAIAAECGGTEIYIPPAPQADHWLSHLVGHDRALAIGEHLTCGIGGARVEIPLGSHGHQAQARRKVDAMIAEGKWSERDIARATGYTIRGVRKRVAMQRDERQLNLL